MQTSFDLPPPRRRVSHGGHRAGSGRKPTGRFGRDPQSGHHRAGVSHDIRPDVAPRAPLHITVRTAHSAPNLRHPAVAASIGVVLKRRAGKERSCRVVHFTLLSDHLHMIVEAADRTALSRGMQGLLSGLARVINRATGCSDRLWNDRYHARPLPTPRELRNCLVYVLRNAKKHGYTTAAVDPLSSAAWFDGFAEHAALRSDRAPVHAPTLWLLKIGWQRAGGPIRADEAPA